jgi:membrane protease YdiL (CAAX protease family)
MFITIHKLFYSLLLLLGGLLCYLIVDIIVSGIVKELTLGGLAKYWMKTGTKTLLLVIYILIFSKKILKCLLKELVVKNRLVWFGFAAFLFSLLIFIIFYQVTYLSNFSINPKLLILATGIALTGALPEELFYRGILYHLLSEKMNKWLIYILCSLPFAMLHMPPDVNLYEFLPSLLEKILFSVVCFLLRDYACSWGVPLLFHFIWNFLSVFVRVESTWIGVDRNYLLAYFVEGYSEWAFNIPYIITWIGCIMFLAGKLYSKNVTAKPLSYRITMLES